MRTFIRSTFTASGFLKGEEDFVIQSIRGTSRYERIEVLLYSTFVQSHSESCVGYKEKK